MIYRVLLEILIAAHFAFILFIVFGALFALVRRWMIFLHLPTLVYGLLIELLNINCPIEPLESWLRDLSFESGFAEGFLEPYLIGLIYPPGWNQSYGNLMAALLLSFNFIVYSLVFLRWRRRSIA
ncbi:MAG: DUF2784 domain-containing protein [Acidobacteriota bacterium]|nr:DUF2784 domain-containing protein [Acidobacteriota bacterium]